mmetsp:Transcript_4770/g.9727  ORF Transcript_4770/g.9727 Transcript_4770/m.9727 type:complete len:290 (+) Transcript_4770:210-1079(+)
MLDDHDGGWRWPDGLQLPGMIELNPTPLRHPSIHVWMGGGLRPTRRRASAGRRVGEDLDRRPHKGEQAAASEMRGSSSALQVALQVAPASPPPVGRHACRRLRGELCSTSGAFLPAWGSLTRPGGAGHVAAVAHYIHRSWCASYRICRIPALTSFWILPITIGFFMWSCAALGSSCMSASTWRMTGSDRMPWISGSAIARSCRAFISSSDSSPRLPLLIMSTQRCTPSLSSSFSGSCFRPSWYVSSALLYSFMKYCTPPLRVYPLAKVGSMAMHFSASALASLKAASFM